MIDLIMNAMKAQIEGHGLQLLNGTWATDFLVHDKAFLEANARTGVKIAWCIGDSHSHMQLLGMHEVDNDMVTAFVRLSASDRFYELTCREHDFRLKELSRESFAELKRTPIPYKLVGSPSSATLFNGSAEVGRIAVHREGPYQDAVYVITTQPIRGILPKDQVALGVWSERLAIKMAGSLFIRTKHVRNEGYDAPQVKAA